MKISNLFKFFKRKLICKHKTIGEGWFVQGVRFRECSDCGEVEIEGTGKHSFTKLVNEEYTHNRK